MRLRSSLLLAMICLIFAVPVHAAEKTSGDSSDSADGVSADDGDKADDAGTTKKKKKKKKDKDKEPDPAAEVEPRSAFGMGAALTVQNFDEGATPALSMRYVSQGSSLLLQVMLGALFQFLAVAADAGVARPRLAGR